MAEDGGVAREVVRPDKFELPTYRFEVSHSIQLSFAGTRDQEIDLLFRRVIVRDVGSAGREIDGSQCCSKSGNLREGSGANGHIEGRRGASLMHRKR